MELIITLKHARDKTQEAYSKIISRESHSEPLAEAEKAVKLAKARFSTYLKTKKLFPDSFYETPLWDLLSGVQQDYDGFHNGGGWNCLNRAVDNLDCIIDEIVKAEVVNA